MPRIARVVAPGLPHHITQRGSRNQKVFFSSADRRSYMGILKEEIEKHCVEIWAYCLMDNHVHFIAVPPNRDSLAKVFREAHKRYARMINQRQGWRGHLWQERFHSFVMDEQYLYAAVRYVEKNPVKAKLVERAEHYAWSSAKAHVKRSEDSLLSRFYLVDEIKNWSSYLLEDEKESVSYEKCLQVHLRTGRPLGAERFIQKVEEATQRGLYKKKAGRPRKNKIDNN